MPGNRMVTLTTFSNPIEAELAKNRLLDEGITAHLLGDIGGNPFAGIGGLFGQMSLLVNGADAERANRVLAEEEADEPPEKEDEKNTAIQAPEWANADRTTADDPEARYRAADREIQPAFARDKEHSLEFREPEERVDEEDEKPEVAWTPDATAIRAWRAAVIGLLLFGVVPFWIYFLLIPLSVIVYSIVLLFSLWSMPGEMSPKGMRRLYGALLINGIIVIGILLNLSAILFLLFARW